MGKLRNNREIGFKYEEIAKKYLILRGLTYVESNFSSRYGEIDLIFKDVKNGEMLVFVEVKYRKNDFFGKAIEMVTKEKQNKILATSQVYILKNKWNSGIRYDIIGIDSFSNNIRWIKNAF
ncbi:YraN family protein [Leptotrichia sp. oral taxon 847]|uniref:YraN family protein n=1 Tax=Leptotrichia sp. oral taxon 847 TaxID=1785996 RepID=UPI000767E9A0|nr:YraN family protein [Leptotrichia sp. oral taxon 847]AMD95986.1 endonuclease [Leptotrichia sp. oral taxon 847]